MALNWYFLQLEKDAKSKYAINSLYRNMSKVNILILVNRHF